MPLIPKVGRKKINMRFLIGTITAVLWLGVALHLFPVWWMFTTSIKPSYEIFKFPPTLWPAHPSLAAYKLLFALGAGGYDVFQYPVKVYMKNSFIITASIMLIQIPITSLMAYALSKLSSPKWSRLLFLYCIGVMLIPGAISLIPRFLLMRYFPFPTKSIPNIPFTDISFPTHSFLNSYWAVILPAIYSPFFLLLFKGFFDTIPSELINAARLDGASELSIFRRIILPVSKPVFAVVSYFSFSAAWNQFMWPLIVLQKNKLYPLSVMMYKFQNFLQYSDVAATTSSSQGRKLLEAGMTYNGLMAIAIIQSIPVFIMFLIFREYLMTGIRLRGFK